MPGFGKDFRQYFRPKAYLNKLNQSIQAYLNKLNQPIQTYDVLNRIQRKCGHLFIERRLKTLIEYFQYFVYFSWIY